MPIINITIDTDQGGTLAQALAALGLPHVVSNLPDDRDLTPKDMLYAEQKVTLPVVGTERILPLQPIDPTAKFPEPTGPALTAMDGDRKRGEPGAGHRRRTNAEIAEDKLYFDSLNVPGHVAVAAMENGIHRDEDQSAQRPTRVTETHSSPATGQPVAAAISSGDERVGPDDAQDAADEAAESAANRTAEPTLDDLRRAVGAYQKKFGMEQAARRTKEILGMPLFEVPSKDFGVMIHKIAAATEHDQKDGAKFTPVQTQSGVVQGAEPAKPAVATRDEVNAALNNYATRYDGSLDPKQMPITREDVPRLLERLFGAGKKSFNDFEKSPENLGRVLAAVRAEIEKNTFGRAAK